VIGEVPAGAQVLIIGRSMDKSWWRVCYTADAKTDCAAAPGDVSAGRQGWVPYSALEVRGRTDTVAKMTPAVPAPVARASATPKPMKVCVSGYIVNTAGGVPLRNWVLQLQSPDGTIRTTRSNSNGRYEFADLTPGTYTVSERVEPGWRVVSPQSSVITVAPAATCVSVDFWNERQESEPPPPER